MELNKPFEFPILLLAFNRPTETKIVFEEIRKRRPSNLYIAVDGPREKKAGEQQKCNEVKAIVNDVDWPCQVHTLFRDSNLGCKVAVSDAITWFFSHVEEGIILEDDCLPNQSFFTFCAEMLQRYRSDHQVMHIGGNNFLGEQSPQSHSYYFSRYNHIWGWASWRRAWKAYDRDLSDLKSMYFNNGLDQLFSGNRSKLYWFYKFYTVKIGKVNTWDYQWTYSIWKNRGVAITPGKNLVSNIGFGVDATHDLGGVSRFDSLPRQELVSLSHPNAINIKEDADVLTEQVVFRLTPLKKFVLSFLVPVLFRNRQLN